MSLHCQSGLATVLGHIVENQRVTVKRYQLILKGDTGLLQLDEHPGGSWVHHSEALPLATENMRLRAALMDLCNQVEKFCTQQGKWWEFNTGPTLASLGESLQEGHQRELLDMIGQSNAERR